MLRELAMSRGETASASEDRLRHLYALNAMRVPALRLAGFVMTAIAVALHNIYVLGAFSGRAYALLVAGLALYSALSWLALHLYYRRPLADGAFDLGWFFHLADLAICALCVYASGGEQSWLFFVLLVPVWNQTYFSARRASISAILAAAIYLALLLYLREVEQRAIALPLAAFRASLLLIVSVYCTLSASVVERSRRRYTRELRDARSSAERRAIQLTALNRMTQTVTSSAELAPMLDAVAGEILAFLNASSCAITLLDANQSTLEVVACRTTRSGGLDVRGLLIPVEQNPACRTAIATRAPVVVAEAQTSPLTAVTHDALRALGVQCLMSVPIVWRGEVIGTISIHTDDAHRIFTDEEAQLASTVASQVAAPIRNARLYDEQKRSRELAERLQRVGRAVTQSLDLDEVLSSILDHVHQVIDFDSGSVQLVDGDALRVVAVYGYGPGEVGITRKFSEYPYNNHLAHHPEPIIMRVPNEMWVDDSQGARKVRSVLGVPLIVHDRIIGAMSIDSHCENAFEQRDADAALAFAHFAAVAVEHARLYAAMQELSIVDSLTRVANRRHFDNVLQTEWRRAMRAAAPFSLMMIDVDDFKAYNDYYGHPAGDAVLQQVASTLHASLQRAGDFIARYGGEEFVVVLPGTDLDGAAPHAETLRRRVEQLAISHRRSRTAGVVTISIGVVSVTADERIGTASLIAAADRQLYEAKRNGRNCVYAGTGEELIRNPARHQAPGSA